MAFASAKPFIGLDPKEDICSEEDEEHISYEMPDVWNMPTSNSKFVSLNQLRFELRFYAQAQEMVIQKLLKVTSDQSYAIEQLEKKVKKLTEQMNKESIN